MHEINSFCLTFKITCNNHLSDKKCWALPCLQFLFQYVLIKSDIISFVNTIFIMHIKNKTLCIAYITLVNCLQAYNINLFGIVDKQWVGGWVKPCLLLVDYRKVWRLWTAPNQKVRIFTFILSELSLFINRI